MLQPIEKTQLYNQVDIRYIVSRLSNLRGVSFTRPSIPGPDR
jgi:hypothetical protein